MSTSPNQVDLPYSQEAFVQVLRWSALGEASPYSHMQIAKWCGEFWCLYLDVDAPPDIEPLLPTLTSVETQWNLYLSNTYSVGDLRAQTLEEVRLPSAWFEEWIVEVEVATRRA
jgi:hypothetical protein